MSHTPGPWEVGENRGVWTGPVVMSNNGRRGVAFVCGDSDANASLIAAAPDLLAELKHLLAEWEESIAYEPDYMHLGNPARAAIAKAEGRSE